MKYFIIVLLSSLSLASNPEGRFDTKVKYEYNVFLEVLNLKLGEASLSINNPDTINDVNERLEREGASTFDIED